MKIETGKNNPILRKKSQPVKKNDEKIRLLAKNMIKTMIKKDGVGLSACQVGKNIRMFVAHPGNVFINPKIIKLSKKTDIAEEGCLSLPNIFVSIKRAESLKIKALDENNKEFKLKAKDLLARIIQHEIDHLNGIIITDYEKN